jgi:hypothetical protein
MQMSNMNLLGKLIIVILQMPCLGCMGKAVSPTVELLKLEPSNSVNSFSFVMWAFGSH